MKLESDRSFPPELQSLVVAAHARLSASHAVERLWARDHRLWKQDPTDITNRLGWLTVIEDMKDRIEELRTFAAAAKKRGIRDVVLLGMGGSSLGPEVFRTTFGSSPGFPRVWVLDSTVPGWVQQVTRVIDPARSLFILASKSGGTIEVMSLFAHFWEHVHQTPGHQGGAQFIAITDPGTGLEKLATEHRFWRIFTNPPDIGGRYSVLSYFGLVPAALMGVDIARLLARATVMAQACRIQSPLEQNPGADLGATMASLAQAGRNKVTLIASPQIAAFGLWAEQLLAESTGKEGTGLIPVAHEPIVAPTAYGTDRLFIYLRLKGDQNRPLDRQVAKLAREGHPILTLILQDRYDLAGEFFRWEVATALAGHLLGIHPFDQPNVQESKDNTARVLATIQSTGRLPMQATTTAAQAASHLKRHGRPGAYVAILAYTTPSSKMEQGIRMLRKALLSYHHVTTTSGYGPRYLHSTGQLHKGGPRSGLFLQLVDQMTPDLIIPGNRSPFAPSRRPKPPATSRHSTLMNSRPSSCLWARTPSRRFRHSRNPYPHVRRFDTQLCGAPSAGVPARSRMPEAPDIRIHSDSQAVAEAAAAFVLEAGNEAVRAKGRFLIALSGGTTPESLYRALASPAFADRFDWSRATFFFSDERCVPPGDPRSNYALAKKVLFTPLNITPEQVYRMAGESSDPQAAASEYEQQLRLATKTLPSAQPSLDLVLLGLGEDGHTASLFPGASILGDQQRLIAATQSPKDPPNRLTMTLAAINRASVILFLVAGTGKAGVVRATLDPKTEAERQLPASLVEPEKGRLIWFLDRAAAAELPIQ